MTDSPIQDLIFRGLEQRITEFVRERVEKAKKDLDARVPEIVAGIVVDITKVAEFQINSDRVIFTIRKL